MKTLHPVLILATVLSFAPLAAERPVAARSVQPAAAASSPGVFRRYFPQTETALPASYPFIRPQQMRLTGAGFQVQVFAKKLAQGEVAYLEITRLPGTPQASAELEPVLTFEKKPVKLTKLSWGWRAILALAPTMPAPGWKTLTIKTDNASADMRIFVQKVNFPVFHNVMNIPALSNTTQQTKPETLQFIQKCQEKKNRVFSRINPDTISNRISFPRTMYRVTSPYYAKRVYDRFQMQNGKRVQLPSTWHYHTGLDLYARTGEPIFAMLDGTVAIAENMFYEGGFVAIDHGNQIFTMYMHQSKINVREGQFVRAGELIGLAGATGAATGSHLHLSLYIGGVPLDPMGLLSLPIRN